MIINNFTAAMSKEELFSGEKRYQEAEKSRRLAMNAGLTKSSEELNRAWKKDKDLYIIALSGAIAAYEENKNLEELLLGAIARLVSVIDQEGYEAVDTAMTILRENSAEKAS